ncbi:DNA methyltransferase [Spirosoma rhododendri]|uniref:Site-specific DNA-methyltransferase n=1 Tax=Spirosoma rhododendri TaxID=2728024 RepID=A0A7L5DHE1_9BACT|nr:DNA methyltransferase [Spirosoma rhododendri]QJD77435.1 site-specific DNA-methyltransferase [Spirosoma rhododendri]
MTGLATKEQRPNLHYDLIDTETGRIFESPPKGWRYEPSTMSKKIAEGRVLFPSDNGRPRHKLFLHEMDSLNKNLSSVITSITTGEGTKEVNELLGDGNFSFPKPSALIKLLITQITNELDNDIVLDFFAGSGTTAQAVLEANEDGGNRRFILVQLDEGTDKPNYPTIAHITRERIRKVIHKLNQVRDRSLNFNPESVKRLGFRALKLDSSNFKIWQQSDSSHTLVQQLAMFADNLEPGRTDEDRLYEIILKTGLPLETKIDQVLIANNYVYSLEKGSIIVCLVTRLSMEMLNEILRPISSPKRQRPKLVICLDSAFNGNDSLKTNAVLEAQMNSIMLKTI